jgi:cytidylate kinase
MVDADCIRDVAARVVMGVAAEGRAVIVGRGSAYSLRDWPDAFHVFVYAPVEDRLKRMQDAGETRDRAIELIASVDRDRAAFIKKYFGREWPDRHLFHLMINSVVGEAVAADIIVQSLQRTRGGS